MAFLKRSLTAALALALALTSACGQDNGTQGPPDGGSSAYGLALVGNAVLMLHPADLKDLQVVLAQNEVGPVKNARIQFAFDDGDPAGAKLSTVAATTADDGTAGVKLTAGSKTTFKVVASAPDYPEVRPVAFSVSVLPVKRLLQIVGGPNVKVATDGESAQVTMFISSSVGLKVRLLDQDSGAPIAGEDVTFSLPAASKCTFSGATPRSATVKTGADGSAQVFLISTNQTEVGVISTAQVASGGVGSVSFTIAVNANSTGGGCTVNSQCPSGQICSAGVCTTPTGGGSCTPGSDHPCPFGYECVNGQCVPPANTQCDPNNPNCPSGQYCACAGAPGSQICQCTDICPTCPVGQTCDPSSHTCKDNPPPTPDVTGVWYTKHTFNLKAALPGLVQQIAKIIRVIDQLITGTFFTGTWAWLNSIVKAIIDQYVPAWVKMVVKILDTIGTVLSFLRSEGAMRLNPNGGTDFLNVRGTEVWTGLVFYFLPLCGDNIGGDPELPPDCARFDVATTDADNPADVGQCKGQSIPAVSVQVEPFLAHVAAPGAAGGAYKLNYDQRKVQLKFGKLVLVVINLLISYLTEYECIDEALDCAPGNQCLIDCAALGQTINNLFPFIPASLVEGICYPLVTAAGKAITGLLAGISFETDVLDFKGWSTIDEKAPTNPPAIDNTTCQSGQKCANALGKADYDKQTVKTPATRDGFWEGAFFMKALKNMPGGTRATRDPGLK